MELYIEASNIYFGGGFVLLDQILNYCEKNSLITRVYIGYSEVYNVLKNRNFKCIHLEKTNSFSTIFRYCRKRQHVLFFCNLPPFAMNKNSVLYAHNILFFKKPSFDKKQSLQFNLKKYLYHGWIKYFSKNVNVVACQTEDVKESLQKHLNVKADLFPFYKTINPLNLEKEFDFCYVSSVAPHKNHKRLLEAISILAKTKKFNIAVTISDKPENRFLLDEISAINSRFAGEIIVNKGFLSNEETLKLYSNSRALVFPSLEETIALPLIEAIQSEIKVLSADRPYSWQVIDNPVVFDPYNPDSIAKIMDDFLDDQFVDVKQKIKVPNRLPELIACLSQ